MHNFFLRPTLTLWLLGTALAGCGSKPESQAPAITVDACTLFTAEEAKAVAGESVAAMSSTLDDAVGRDPGQCIYNSGTLDEPRILSLLLRQHRSPESAKRVLEASRGTFSTMSGGRIQEVPGLGDAALWAGGKIQQLHVLHGATQMIVTVDSPDGADQFASARRVAEKALERLKQAEAAKS